MRVESDDGAESENFGLDLIVCCSYDNRKVAADAV